MKGFTSKEGSKYASLILGVASLGGLIYLGLKQIKCGKCCKKTCSANLQKKREVVSITNEKIEELTDDSFPEIINKYAQAFFESKVLEWILPRKITEEEYSAISKNSPYSKGQHDFDAIQKALCIPIWDLFDRGGKRWRPILGMFLAECFGKSFEDIKEIAGVCEFIHNGSLIVDDIEDDSEYRREKPCLHKIYGVDVSINAGNMMYFLPIHRLKESKKYDDKTLLSLLEIYLDEMVHIHFGQGWDIVWHSYYIKEGRIPTEEQYIQMVSHKTGVLPRMLTRMTSLVCGLDSKTAEKLSLFSERIGLAFQIQDDILNLTESEFTKGKGYLGEDIHEGKMSIMVIHSLRNGSDKDKNRLINILCQKTTDQNLINEAINIIKSTGSIEHAFKVSERLICEAWQIVKDILPENPGKYKLHLLSNYCISRKK